MPLARSRIILNSASRKRIGSAVPHFWSVKTRLLTKKTSARKGVSPKSGVVISAVRSGMFCVLERVPPGTEHVERLAVAEEHRPLVLAHDQLRADLELPGTLLGDPVHHLGAEFVDDTR